MKFSLQTTAVFLLVFGQAICIAMLLSRQAYVESHLRENRQFVMQIEQRTEALEIWAFHSGGTTSDQIDIHQLQGQVVALREQLEMWERGK